MNRPVNKPNPFVENKKPRISFLAMASLGMAILAAIALILLLSQGESILLEKNIFKITCNNGLPGNDCSYEWYSGPDYRNQTLWIAQAQTMGQAGMLLIYVPAVISLLLAIVIIGGGYFLAKIS